MIFVLGNTVDTRHPPYHISPWTKNAPKLQIITFKCNFINESLLSLDNFAIEACLTGYDWWEVSIGLGYGMVQSRQEAIILTNGDQLQRCLWCTGGDELKVNWLSSQKYVHTLHVNMQNMECAN